MDLTVFTIMNSSYSSSYATLMRCSDGILLHTRTLCKGDPNRASSEMTGAIFTAYCFHRPWLQRRNHRLMRWACLNVRYTNSASATTLGAGGNLTIQRFASQCTFSRSTSSRSANRVQALPSASLMTPLKNVSTTPSHKPYSTPKTGVVSFLPASIIPYAELIRLDKPAGTIYLFFPCLFSTLLAATYVPITPPATALLSFTALFFSGAFIMRGAGCTVNDLWDRNLDPHV